MQIPSNNICPICGGTAQKATRTLTKKRGGQVFVFNNVPVTTCTQCGETWYHAKVLRNIEHLIDAGETKPVAPVFDFSYASL